MESDLKMKPQSNWRFLVYYAALAGVGLAGILGPTLSGLAAQTQTTLQFISGLFVAKSIGYVAGSLLAGRAYDRWPGHPILVCVILGLAGSLALTPLLPWWQILMVVTGLVGFTEGGIDVGTNTLIVWEYGERVGPYMNGLHFAFGVGAFFGPLIVGQALQWTGGITWAYWTLALIILPLAVWVMRLPSPKPQVHSEAQTGALNVVLVALFVACFFFYVGSEVAFGSWVYNYAVRLSLADEVTAAYLTSAFWGALTLGRLVAIPLAARLRPRTILFINLGGGLLSLAIIITFSASALVLWAGTLGLGLSMASTFPTLMNLAGRRLTMTGLVTSFFFVGGSLGAMTGPWLIGQLFEPIGPHTAPLVVLGAVGLNCAAFIALILYAPRGATTE